MSNILVGIVLSFVFVCSRMITYGVMANFNMDGKGTKEGSGRQMHIKWLYVSKLSVYLSTGQIS